MGCSGSKGTETQQKEENKPEENPAENGAAAEGEEMFLCLRFKLLL